MTLNPETTEKITSLLLKVYPNLTREELDKIAQEFYELGLFFVRLKIKQHSKPPKPQNTEGFEQITEKPP